jgi:hypothetical protein
MKHLFREMGRSEGEVIAMFGEARLVKTLDCKLELRGGSKEDLVEAREWIAMFLKGTVVKELGGWKS